MNKILEEFKRIKTERNKFIDETNRKGEILLSQANNKFDSLHNSNKIMKKNNLEKEYEYLDSIKNNLKKAINLKDELDSYNSFFNKCFNDLILFLETKIKDILNKNKETINEEEDDECLQDIIKLANLTKILVEENKNIIKNDSNEQKQNILMQLKDNYNIIDNLSTSIISNIKNKSIIDKLSKILNYISEYIIFIYNDINLINFNNNNNHDNNYLSDYLLNSIFFNNFKNINNSKIWKLIITKNNNQEVTFSQSNFKIGKYKLKKMPKNYSIKIYIEKINNTEKTIKLITYIISYIKNKIMTYFVITNNLKSKLEGYYCFQIFGIGKRKKKIIQKFQNLIEKINNKSIYNNFNIMIKASLYNDIEILMKNKIFKLLKNEIQKYNEKKENTKNNTSIITINDLIILVKNNIHYNFDEDFLKKYLNLDNIF